MHKFTAEQKRYIEKNVLGRGNARLTKMFNAHFGLNLTTRQIKSYKSNHKLSSGLTGQFPKGCEPWNKGKKGVACGGKETQFKKGNRPWNYMPVGSERINGDRYVEIKIADPNKWKGKHILVWEEHNGPVPKGHVVIFGDGNRFNFDPDNLLLVTRKQLVRMNQRGLIRDSTELTKSGIIIADIYNKIGERKRGPKKPSYRT